MTLFVCVIAMESVLCFSPRRCFHFLCKGAENILSTASQISWHLQKTVGKPSHWEGRGNHESTLDILFLGSVSLDMISMETFCLAGPSVLTAYSPLKPSLMKDGSPKVHKFDLHSHSMLGYPSELLWPGNQVRNAMRPSSQERVL